MRQDSRNIAVVLTAICAVLAVGLVGLTIGSEGQGATALWLMLPMIAVVAAHIFMGPAAMILALLSRRLWVTLGISPRGFTAAGFGEPNHRVLVDLC